MAAALRKSPFQVNVVIAGYDEEEQTDVLIVSLKQANDLYSRDCGSFNEKVDKITIHYCAEKYGISSSNLYRR